VGCKIPINQSINQQSYWPPSILQLSAGLYLKDLLYVVAIRVCQSSW